MNSASILAIDLGKFKSTACLYQAADSEFAVESFVTEREGLRRLLAKHRPGVVVIEACLLAGWVSDCCGEACVPCKVANTASEAWKFKHAKRKTDRDDALRLAQLEALGQLPTSPEGRVARARSLVDPRVTSRCRQRMTERMGRGANPDAWGGRTETSAAETRIAECSPTGKQQREPRNPP